VLAIAREEEMPSDAKEIIKDPMVLAFLRFLILMQIIFLYVYQR